jgi:hypothetical protein
MGALIAVAGQKEKARKGKTEGSDTLPEQRE